MSPRRRRRQPTQRELAARYGLSRRTIASYRAAGVNVASAAAVRRHQQTLRHCGLLPGRSAPGSALARAKLALLSAKADKAELRARQLRRDLVPADQVRADVERIRATVERELLALADSLPPALAGREPGEMEPAIRDATTRTLARLADVAAFA